MKYRVASTSTTNCRFVICNLRVHQTTINLLFLSNLRIIILFVTILIDRHFLTLLIDWEVSQSLYTMFSIYICSEDINLEITLRTIYHCLKSAQYCYSSHFTKLSQETSWPGLQLILALHRVHKGHWKLYFPYVSLRISLLLHLVVLTHLSLPTKLLFLRPRFIYWDNMADRGSVVAAVPWEKAHRLQAAAHQQSKTQLSHWSALTMSSSGGGRHCRQRRWCLETTWWLSVEVLPQRGR